MDLTLRAKILQTLLKSPKSTGEIAKKLGYIDKNRNGKYNVVGPDLEKLKESGLIRSQKIKGKTHGPPPTIYNIVYEFPVIQKLSDEHPKLIQDLQSNDTILSMLVKKHGWIFKPPTPISIPEFEKLEDTPCPETQIPEHKFDNMKARAKAGDDLLALEKRLIEIEPEYLALKKGIEEILTERDKECNKAYLRESEKKLKRKLELSADFFKICILNEPDNLKNIFDEIFWQTREGQLYQLMQEAIKKYRVVTVASYTTPNKKITLVTENFPPSPRKHPSTNLYSKCSDIIFESCVYHDVLTGHKNATAIEYLKEMIKNEILEGISTTESEHVEYY
jgi:hypothetical protein